MTKYSIFIFFATDAAALAPIAFLKTPSAAFAALAALNSSTYFAPVVGPKMSPTALNMEIMSAMSFLPDLNFLFRFFGCVVACVAFAASVVAVVEFFISLKKSFAELKAEIKADVEKVGNELEKVGNELKADFRGLKTDVNTKIDSFQSSFSVRFEAQDKLIEANGIKMEAQFLIHEAWNQAMGNMIEGKLLLRDTEFEAHDKENAR
jgi:hypothetical protein